MIVYVNHICIAPSQQKLEECLTKCPGPQPSQQDAQSWPTLWLTPLLSYWHNTLQWLMMREVLGFVCHFTFSQTISSGSSMLVPSDETYHLFICPHVCLHLLFFFLINTEYLWMLVQILRLKWILSYQTPLGILSQFSILQSLISSKKYYY